MTDGSGQLAGANRPTRVAIIGSGPAGFYAADTLLKQVDTRIEIDMFERLAAPFGLVRFGVAPDHQRIKRAAAAFERTASHANFRFLGNVHVGRDVTLTELREHYDEVLVAIGAASDRKLGIPGEDLAGAHSATAFVGWYNGHPDFRDHHFDLSAERAVVIGVGNVAMDVARILVRSPDELAETDITQFALEELRKSRIREVVVVGRRSAAQAAFDAGELLDMANLNGVEVRVDPEQVVPEFAGENELDAATRQNLVTLRKIAATNKAGASRRVTLRFLLSPAELIGENGRVTAIKFEQNRIDVDASGAAKAVGTGQFVQIDCGFVLRSIGYRGIPLPELPFDERTGTIPNQAGRVTSGFGGPALPGLYVTGWIKRGPTGLIGANKPDAQETARHMLADAAALSAVPRPARDAIDRLLEERGVRIVTFRDWRVLDQLEQAAGKSLGKIREKFCSQEEMLKALASR